MPREYGIEKIMGRFEPVEAGKTPFYLSVRLGEGGKYFELPGINVGSAEEPVTIFLWDPRGRDDLALASAQELAGFMDGALIITPDSEKSIPTIEIAVALNKQKTGNCNKSVMVIERDESKIEMRRRCDGEPVMGKSIKGKEQWFAINSQQGEKIRNVLERGQNVICCDDVRSTGATEQAIVQALILAGGDIVLKPEQRVNYREMIRVICSGQEEINIDPAVLSEQIKFVYLFEEYPQILGGKVPPIPGHIQAVARIPALVGNNPGEFLSNKYSSGL